MTQKYKITNDCIKYLNRYNWISSNYFVGEVGSEDSREITRLLINHHYDGLRNILQLIDTIGSCVGGITDKLFQCNDPMNFSRLLAELYLFNYLYRRVGNCVESNIEDSDGTTHDINVTLNGLHIRIEVYSPTESYSYQLFLNRVQSLLKNINTDFGFDLKIESESNTVDYVYKFPPFRIILKWLEKFEAEFIAWFESAGENHTKSFNSPLDGYVLNISINRKDDDVENRLIIWGGATYSTDLKLYFEINDPTRLSKTNLGKNISEKLSKQQAGGSEENIVRILIINFALADSTDLSFLNNKKIRVNIENDLKLLASNIQPFPPYDIVIPSDLGLDCGFSEPIIFDNNRYNDFSSHYNSLGFDNPIKEIPRATEEEVQEMIEAMMNVTDE